MASPEATEDRDIYRNKIYSGLHNEFGSFRRVLNTLMEEVIDAPEGTFSPPELLGLGLTGSLAVVRQLEAVTRKINDKKNQPIADFRQRTLGIIRGDAYAMVTADRTVGRLVVPIGSPSQWGEYGVRDGSSVDKIFAVTITGQPEDAYELHGIDTPMVSYELDDRVASGEVIFGIGDSFTAHDGDSQVYFQALHRTLVISEQK